jgi:hypothetical protein
MCTGFATGRCVDVGRWIAGAGERQGSAVVNDADVYFPNREKQLAELPTMRADTCLIRQVGQRKIPSRHIARAAGFEGNLLFPFFTNHDYSPYTIILIGFFSWYLLP